jgi:hypothetical protein
MNTRKLLLTTLLVTVLAGCGRETDNAKNSEQNSNAKEATESIIISRDGVGPINASTPFNMHQITLGFQDYSVTEYTQFKDGNSTPVIRISEDGKPIITVNPDQSLDKIFSVFVTSPEIGSALGHTVGMPYSEIYTYDEAEPCIPGTDDFVNKVLCIAPKTPNILYAFTGKWDGPKNETPPIAILSSWKLDSIVWRPE